MWTVTFVDDPIFSVNGDGTGDRLYVKVAGYTTIYEFTDASQLVQGDNLPAYVIVPGDTWPDALVDRMDAEQGDHGNQQVAITYTDVPPVVQITDGLTGTIQAIWARSGTGDNCAARITVTNSEASLSGGGKIMHNERQPFNKTAPYPSERAVMSGQSVAQAITDAGSAATDILVHRGATWDLTYPIPSNINLISVPYQCQFDDLPRLLAPPRMGTPKRTESVDTRSNADPLTVANTLSGICRHIWWVLPVAWADIDTLHMHIQTDWLTDAYQTDTVIPIAPLVGAVYDTDGPGADTSRTNDLFTMASTSYSGHELTLSLNISFPFVNGLNFAIHNAAHAEQGAVGHLAYEEADLSDYPFQDFRLQCTANSETLTYSDSTTDVAIWLNCSGKPGMALGIFAAQDSSVANLDHFEGNWSVWPDGAAQGSAAPWQTSGTEDLLNGGSYFVEIGEESAPTWGCTFKDAANGQIEFYRIFKPDYLMWRNGAVGKWPFDSENMSNGDTLKWDSVCLYLAPS